MVLKCKNIYFCMVCVLTWMTSNSVFYMLNIILRSACLPLGGTMKITFSIIIQTLSRSRIELSTQRCADPLNYEGRQSILLSYLYGYIYICFKLQFFVYFKIRFTKIPYYFLFIIIFYLYNLPQYLVINFSKISKIIYCEMVQRL